MIAYNDKSLDALKINNEAHMAMRSNLISKEEFIAIKNVYPESLYTPNLFIRIALVLLTVVIVSMSFGLYFLLFGSFLEMETGIGIFTGIFSLLVYATLEMMVGKYKHFRSGVDDALLWLSMGFMVGAVNIAETHMSFLNQAIIALVLAAYASWRFANQLMAGILFISFLAVVVFGVVPLWDFAKPVMPFLLMGISLLVYVLVKKNSGRKILRHYHSCCILIEVLSLIFAYGAVNYFVVREAGNELFGLRLAPGSSLPGDWFFWAATIFIPLIYLTRGLQKKDSILLRTGLLLIAAMIFTIRYYYHIASVEMAMTTGGITLIVITYIVTRYLTTPRHGITNATLNNARLSLLTQSESLILAETFHQSPDTGKHFDFGGGSGGGGGATGQY